MKKILLLFFVGVFCNHLQAAFLYWQVEPSPLNAGSDSEITYNFATVHAVKGETDIAMSVADSQTGETQTGWTVVASDDESKYAFNLDQLGDYTQYSFYVEVKNFDEATFKFEVRGYSRVETYADLVASNYIDTGMMPSFPAVVWHGSGYNVPEPTGGLLMLVSLGLLGLKRKKYNEKI